MRYNALSWDSLDCIVQSYDYVYRPNLQAYTFVCIYDGYIDIFVDKDSLCEGISNGN